MNLLPETRSAGYTMQSCRARRQQIQHCTEGLTIENWRLQGQAFKVEVRVTGVIEACPFLRLCPVSGAATVIKMQLPPSVSEDSVWLRVL